MLFCTTIPSSLLFPFSFPIASSYISNAALKSLSFKLVYIEMVLYVDFSKWLKLQVFGVHFKYYIINETCMCGYLFPNWRWNSIRMLHVYKVAYSRLDFNCQKSRVDISPAAIGYCNGKGIKRGAQSPSRQSGVSYERICAIISTTVCTLLYVLVLSVWNWGFF